eukprot:727069-Prorocentrum_lima.AAC.1
MVVTLHLLKEAVTTSATRYFSGLGLVCVAKELAGKDIAMPTGQGLPQDQAGLGDESSLSGQQLQNYLAS